MFTIKSSSQTRWSANADETQALRQNYFHILSTLFEISQNKYENVDTRTDGVSILKTEKLLH